MNAAAAVLLTLALTEPAPPVPPATFAVILGVNQSVDTDSPTLRYADDDAARYFDLFGVLGARTYLLTELDESTARVHTQAAAEARPPTGDQLKQVVAAVGDDVTRARERGIETLLYVVYAGHGKADDGQGYVTLADRRLTGHELATEIVDAIGATQTHLIVDACFSIFLAFGRGPGGEHRPLSGFSRLPGIGDDPRVGLLLSTSAARESHEWEGFQAGVFSHAVRSGLYGAADADNDGIVTYVEIAAFVQQAGAAIPNERFRPTIFARPPVGHDDLVSLRGERSRILIPPRAHGRYLLEDSRGVRILDFHNAADQEVTLVRPLQVGRLYLRRTDQSREYVLPLNPKVVNVAALSPHPPRSMARGAAHDAFTLLFRLPFGAATVGRQPTDVPAWQLHAVDAPAAPSWSTILGWSGTALGGTALLAGGGCTLAAWRLQRSIDTTTPHRKVVARNQETTRLNQAAVALYATGAAALTAGLWALVFAGAPPPAQVTAAGGSVGVVVAY